MNNETHTQNQNDRPRVEKTESEWREQLTPTQFDVLRGHGTERAFTGKYFRREARRHISLRRLWRRAVLVRHEVRLRHRLAELYRAG